MNRQEGMQAAEAMMAKIKTSIRISDFDQAQHSSRSIWERASVMIDYFPPGSGASINNSSSASNEIWEYPELFKIYINDKKYGAQKMILAAKSKDIHGLEEAFIFTQNTCNSCHERFRN